MKKILAAVLTVIMVTTAAFAAIDNVDSSKLTQTKYKNVLMVEKGVGKGDFEVFENCNPETKAGKVKLLLGRLISSLDYISVGGNEEDITISNGSRRIQLFYNKNTALVDGKEVTLKNAFTVEEKNVYYNYISIEDIEVLFSYKVAYDKAVNNVVLFVTKDTPMAEALPDVPAVSKPEATMEQKLADLKAYKIFQGDENGNLNLDKEITRAEFCKVIFTALGYGEGLTKNDTADGSNMVFDVEENVFVVESESVFSDVSITHWAYGYIKAAYDLGYVNGVGDNRFCPSEPICEVDAIKIIVSALGYAPRAEQTGGYPDGFLQSAERFGIVTDTPHKAILREKVAEYIYTALDVPLMVQSGFDVKTQSPSYVILDGNNGVERSTWRIKLEQIYANEL